MAKKKAKALLTELMREVALEETELIHEDPDNPDSEYRLGSKAEAIVRQIYRMALGYSTWTTKINKDGKSVRHETVHIPDKSAMNIILDRLEGKAAPAAMAGKAPVPIADRVSEQTKKLANKAANES